MALLLTLLVASTTDPKPILAYVDPGSGYLIWQIVAAAGVGCLFFVQKTFKRLARRSKSKKTARKKPALVKKAKIAAPKSRRAG
jgi:hypothetical protein